MAIFYLDPEAGNDANDGTTFANRWKTITLGATTARIAPGDEIRIIGSPPSTDTGINATWNHNSPTVTLDSALNVLITDCETAWTASANVTATTSATRRTGSLACSLAIAAGFTTGKVAYFGLGGAQNYSAYQGITFWIRTNLAFLTGVFEIRLCSDTTGDVAVDTFGITPSGTQVNGYWPMYLDKGSALGSSIQSIAIYALSDPGTLTLLLDNISTVKTKGASQTDNLNLASLIAPGAGAMWWAIRGISGVTLTLEYAPSVDTATLSKGWAGATASYDLLKLETVKVEQIVGSFGQNWVLQESGSAAAPISYTGGWNRSDMSAQNSETWLDGGWGWTYCIYNAASRHYNTLSKINFCRWYHGYYNISGIAANYSGLCRGTSNQGAVFYWSSCTDIVAGDVECTGGGQNSIIITGSLRVTIGNVTGWGGGSNFSGGIIGLGPTISHMVKIGNIDVRNCWWYAIDGTGGVYRLHLGNLYIRDAPGGVFYSGAAATKFCGIVIGNVDADATGNGIVFPQTGGWNWRMGNIVCINGTYGLQHSPPPESFVKSVTTSGNATAGWLTSLNQGMHPGRVRIKATSLTDSLPRSEVGLASYSRVTNAWIALEDYQGVADAHRIEYGGGQSPTALITAEGGSNRHTASGLGWKLAILSTSYKAEWPFHHTIGKIYCAASALVTVRLWVNRSDTGLTVKLVQPGRQINGVANDVVDTAAASASTWEELEVTFTPSEKGIVMPEIQAYGGSTLFVYFDDFFVSQA